MRVGQGRLLSCPPGFHLPTSRGELRVGAQGPESSHLQAPLLWNLTGRGSDLSPRGSCLQNRWAPHWTGEVMVVVSCPLLQLSLPSWPS